MGLSGNTPTPEHSNLPAIDTQPYTSQTEKTCSVFQYREPLAGDPGTKYLGANLADQVWQKWFSWQMSWFSVYTLSRLLRPLPWQPSTFTRSGRLGVSYLAACSASCNKRTLNFLKELHKKSRSTCGWNLNIIGTHPTWGTIPARACAIGIKRGGWRSCSTRTSMRQVSSCRPYLERKAIPTGA